MAANIYIYVPDHEDGPSRDDLEDEIEDFFQGAAHDCGAGAGESGFNLDYEFAKGTDPHAWVERLKAFLVNVGVQPGTRFDVFSDGWEPGVEWRSVEVFGEDRRRVDPP